MLDTELHKPVRKKKRPRTIRVIGGIMLIALGIPLLVLPGPGLLCIGGGAVMIASEFGWKRRKSQSSSNATDKTV
ncbi:MAG: PGPGW domain-containing protein [candidate division Zixibacteria bacterium]